MVRNLKEGRRSCSIEAGTRVKASALTTVLGLVNAEDRINGAPAALLLKLGTVGGVCQCDSGDAHGEIGYVDQGCGSEAD